MDRIESGKIMPGCNYWASDSGIFMWRNWNPKTVEEDLRQISSDGIKIIRVFPLWPDFQPVRAIYGSGMKVLEYQSGGKPCSGSNLSGLSCQMLDRFSEFINLCGKYEVSVIVSLITGWMSGRLFVPPALEGLDIIADPVAIMWQVRFIKAFVSEFKDCQSIVGWGLGNECNVMSKASGKDDAWNWTQSLSDAIRSVDNTKPVLSDMHGLSLTDVWQIDQQAELCDILTVHPYPLFTPLCNNSPVNTMIPMLHGTAESVYYSSVGGKPCIVEETGTLGSMLSSESIAGDFAKTTLYSAWANDCRAYLWWCAYDQKDIKKPPYTKCLFEQELGLYNNSKEEKGSMKGMKEAAKIIANLPFEKLPKPNFDAVCILTKDQDHWPVVLGSYVLGKQAGIEVSFQSLAQPLKEAGFYMLPCIKGYNVIDEEMLDELLERVSCGAALCISYDGGLIKDFDKITGLNVITYHSAQDIPKLVHEDSAKEMPVLKRDIKLTSENAKADVLYQEEDGNPIVAGHSYGKGTVWFLSSPLEKNYAQSHGFADEFNRDFGFMLYKEIFCLSDIGSRITRKNNPFIGITEHENDDGTRFIVCINYSNELQVSEVILKEGCNIENCWYGNCENNERGARITIPPHEMMVLLVSQR